MEQGILTTQRLLLRPLALSDAKDVQRLAGHPLVADTTLSIPHPYPNGCAELWIQRHPGQWAGDKEAHWAITLRESGQLVGVIGLIIQRDHRRAEIGYWVGADYWGKGYCTEAAREVVGYAFHKMRLHRVVGRHFARNPASGRVMQKIGMTYEGCLREHAYKNGRYEDLACYGILREQFGDR